MKPGDAAEIERSFDAADVAALVRLVGGPVPDGVPEPLIGALFSQLLGMVLPGPGTNWLKQTLIHHAPAPLGVPLRARVEVTRLRPEKRLVDLATTCRLPDGTLLCEGRALVLAPLPGMTGALPPARTD